MFKRSPILGYNHNIGHRGLVFHVQTEDSGIENPHIFTHLFHGGVIIFTRKIDYDADADESVVKALMQAQHKAVLKELKRGGFDVKIDAYLGDHPDLEPVRGRDTVPDGAPQGPVTAEGSVDEVDAGETVPGLAVAAVAASADDQGWEPAPEEITSSEVSDVFRVLIQQSADGQDDGDVLIQRVHAAGSEVRLEPLESGPGGRRPPRDTVEIHSAPPSEDVPDIELDVRRSNSPTVRHRAVPPPPPQHGNRPGGHIGPRGTGNILVSRPPIHVDNRATKRAKPPPPRASRPMAPRTVRDDEIDSLFDQQTISEKSLDEVILAYLSEDASKDEP